MTYVKTVSENGTIIFVPIKDNDVYVLYETCGRMQIVYPCDIPLEDEC